MNTWDSELWNAADWQPLAPSGGPGARPSV